MGALEIIGAILGGGSALANIFGPLIGGQQQPEQINPLLEPFLAQLNAQIPQAQIEQGNALQLLSQAIQQQAGLANQMGATTRDIQNLNAPDPNAGFAQFLSNIPGLRETAASVAAQATQLGGRNIQEQAQLASQTAAKNAARSIPGGSSYSGAQAATVSQAAAQPIADAMAQLAGLQSQNFMNTFNNLAGQNQALSFQGQQQGFENALGQLQSVLSGQGQEANVLGNVGQQRASQYNTASSQLANLMNQLGSVSAPVYSTPSTYNPLGSVGQGLGDLSAIFGGMGSQNTLQKILDAINGG